MGGNQVNKIISLLWCTLLAKKNRKVNKKAAWYPGATKATPSGITVSGLGHSLLSRRAGGSTHYAIIHHSNLKVT